MALPVLARSRPSSLLRSLLCSLFAGAGFVLAGCSSLGGPNDLAGPPGATYPTSKSPMAYAQCLRPLWQATRVVGGKATVDTVPGPNGSLRMTLNIAGAPGRVLEILPQGSGATVRYWNRSNDWGGGGATKPKAVVDMESCL
ncbi:hypothetical protein D621_19370 [beta proteobacterium AAP51]|nr:hypothetical protein D621_19370 [beta proteobacterium AAP51]